MICKAMFAVSIDLFINISWNVQQRHVKCPGLAGFLHQLNKRFALSPDEASEIIAILGLALMLLSLNWVSQLQCKSS